MNEFGIVECPDPVLRQVSSPVVAFDTQISSLTQQLTNTMLRSGGIGLSAPQLGVSKRIIAAKLTDQSSLVFINPTISKKSKPGWVNESCLSIPSVTGNVVRATEITVEAKDLSGNPFTMQLCGMDAVCVQHEIDHLDGILFIDRLSKFKKWCMQLTANGRNALNALPAPALQQ